MKFDKKCSFRLSANNSVLGVSSGSYYSHIIRYCSEAYCNCMMCSNHEFEEENNNSVMSIRLSLVMSTG